MSKNKTSSSQKILIIGERFYPEEFLINDLADEWSKSGYCVEVLTQNPSYPFGKVFKGFKNRLFQITYYNAIKIYRFYTVQGYKTNKILKILNYFHFALTGSIIALIIGHNYKKIFVYQTGPLTLAIPAVLLKIFYRKKLFIWIWDIWPDAVYSYGFKKTKMLSVFLDSLVKLVYRNSDVLFFSSPGFENRIKYYLSAEKRLIYAPNWIPEYITISPSVSPFRPVRVFTFAGNIGKVQNLENVIIGFTKARSYVPNIELHILGDGSSLQDLEKIVKERNYENIIFYGKKNIAEVNSYFEKSDVLIISLKEDPLFELYIPSKFQVYLGTGKPVFCILNGTVRDLVKKHQIGLSSNPSDTEEISQTFVRFTELNENDLKIMKVNALNLLQNSFNREKIISTLTQTIWFPTT